MLEWDTVGWVPEWEEEGWAAEQGPVYFRKPTLRSDPNASSNSHQLMNACVHMRHHCTAQGKAVSYRKPAFGSDAGRSGLVDRRSLSNPGPGRYNTTKDVAKSLKPITNPAPESIFGSQVGPISHSFCVVWAQQAGRDRWAVGHGCGHILKCATAQPMPGHTHHQHGH